MSSAINDEENPLLTGTMFASAKPFLKKARDRLAEAERAPICCYGQCSKCKPQDLPPERVADLHTAAKNYRDALRLEQEAAHALAEARKHFEQCERLADQAFDTLDEIAQNIDD